MTHGWPGSVIELLEAVGPLTDPTAHGGRAEDAFDLVLPSLPGYGFSGEPTELGWDPGRVARAWAELMHRLGYTRYVAQGGDVGAAVTDAMGRQAPEGLVGIHTNLLVTGAGRRRPPDGHRGGTRGARRARHIPGERLRLLPRAGHAAADDRLRAAGLTRRPGGLDARPRHGQLLQDLPRVRRRAARGQPHPGPHPRQHHAVLADGHRRLGGAVVLGERTSRRPRRGRPGSSAGLAPGRLHHVPRRDLPGAAQLGRASTPTSPTSTRPTRAATSPPGRSRSSSRARCGRRSGRCGEPSSASDTARRSRRAACRGRSWRSSTARPGGSIRRRSRRGPAREGRARRLLDVHLHQLAAHARRTSARGPRSTRITGWSWSASTRPSSRSSTTSTTSARPRRR